ncbi:MAG: outer membrane protein assembly factor BamD [Helicobacteraceae bacterium 4484_230]|nr:MAG: outer membrane protein assembly factor BamD [Helicobacteraceae bacterium 4484_230]
MIKIIMATAVLIMVFGGCSKDLDEYNQPAAYWYKKMIKYVSDGNLEKADNYYSSLQSEHIGSPLLPEATIIMAIAHLQHEEYLLAEHFINEYIKRYATVNEREYAEFLKVKAKYMALPNPRRDQGLIKEAIKEGDAFKRNYPKSSYYPIVDTMLTSLYLAQASLNESIADLYERLDKPKSASYYRTIKPEPWIEWDKVEPADVTWYRRMFEGDGTASWYGFIIPDTKSVVSRHSNIDSGSLENSDAKMETLEQREQRGQEELNPQHQGPQ